MKTLKTILLSTFVAGSLATTTAIAESAKPNPYSDCGIGAALFAKNETAAIISNVIWDLGTTAFTSATASPDTCKAKSVETAQFILESYDNLTEEVAQGSGEHLAALMDILSVEEAERPNTIAQLRNKLSHIVSTASYTSNDKVSKASDFYDALMVTIPSV